MTAAGGSAADALFLIPDHVSRVFKDLFAGVTCSTLLATPYALLLDLAWMSAKFCRGPLCRTDRALYKTQLRSTLEATILFGLRRKFEDFCASLAVATFAARDHGEGRK